MTDVHLTVLMTLRWIHVTAAMLWVGLSYFLNFVLAPSVKRMDPPSRRTLLPGVLERAVFWMKTGALVTYITGWAYLLYKCYGESNVGFHGENGLAHSTWGQWVSIGVIVGTVLFVNVWWVIAPAQTKLIRWMRAGETPPEFARLSARAEKASKVNVYLSVPLIFSMSAASHLPVINGWIVAGMFLAGFALVAHLYLIASRIFGRS
jgi:uncharacterized membrane protein